MPEIRPLIDTLVFDLLRACDPGEAVTKSLKQHAPPGGNLAVLAVGKGAVRMAETAAAHLGDRTHEALIICPPEHIETAKSIDSAEVWPADHPLATERNLNAAQRAHTFITSAGRAHRPVLFLLSGGASAYLLMPAPGVSVEDVRTITGDLLRSGADIQELNTVRKHCELLKGGRLAAEAIGAGVPTLDVRTLSDVLGDPLDTIGSGTAAPDPTTYADAIAVLERRGIAAPASVREHLERGAAGEIAETPKPGDALFESVSQRVVLNNRAAIHGVVGTLQRAGFDVRETREGVTGEAGDVAKQLADKGRTLPPRSAVVWGGETTVTVGDAPGRGGRNQELALAAAIEIAGDSLAVVSIATDGVDGPTDAAGGWADGETADVIRAAGHDPAAMLADHNSAAALAASRTLIRTGPTGTNVNDVMIAMSPAPKSA